MSEPANPSVYDDLLTEAATALTAAARMSEQWTNPDGTRREQRLDFAESVALAVTAAAANVGGVKEALAGRSGAWEADLVRRLVGGTAVWDGEDLDRHRAEPPTLAPAP